MAVVELAAAGLDLFKQSLDMVKRNHISLLSVSMGNVVYHSFLLCLFLCVCVVCMHVFVIGKVYGSTYVWYM